MDVQSICTCSILISMIHELVTSLDCILGYKENINEYKKAEIEQFIFFYWEIHFYLS